MNKAIITIYGRASEGKSETVKNVCRLILSTWPTATYSTYNGTPLDYSQDILLSIDIGVTKIGIESQGDPNSRMISEDSILQLADRAVNPILGGCELIICTSRTEGMTVQKVDHIAQAHHFRTLWKSSYYTPDFSHGAVNQVCAAETLDLIKSIILGIL